jgi:hypothetical protein
VGLAGEAEKAKGCCAPKPELKGDSARTHFGATTAGHAAMMWRKKRERGWDLDQRGTVSAREQSAWTADGAGAMPSESRNKKGSRPSPWRPLKSEATCLRDDVLTRRSEQRGGPRRGDSTKSAERRRKNLGHNVRHVIGHNSLIGRTAIVCNVNYSRRLDTKNKGAIDCSITAGDFCLRSPLSHIRIAPESVTRVNAMGQREALMWTCLGAANYNLL